MLSKNVEVFMACEKEADEANIVLFGAPFEILRHPIVPAQGSEAVRSGENLTG